MASAGSLIPFQTVIPVLEGSTSPRSSNAQPLTRHQRLLLPPPRDKIQRWIISHTASPTGPVNAA